jgi:DNA polymerase III epsilon subunit-like protein
MSKKNVMLDLETMAVSPDAAILTIGAVKFDRKELVQPSLETSDTFYRRISLDSCIAAQLHVAEETRAWWNSQNRDAKYEALINPDRVPLSQALAEFKDWFGDARYIWSHGDDFDCVILGWAFHACNIEKPWQFWNTRDTRTLFDLAGVRMYELPANNPHHALHDAYRQVVGVKKALNLLIHS